MKKVFIFLCSLATLSLASKAEACTRVVYTGTDGMVVTGRTMDWKTELESNIWVFPRGMKRNGETGQNSLQWTSKYGSVVHQLLK